MILTFSKQQFKDRILEGTKIHTIRTDTKCRWKKGMKVHYWLHNPRNKYKNPHCFAVGECVAAISICIYPNENQILLYPGIVISTIDQLNTFAKRDEMKTFFPENYRGRIIYFKVTEVTP